MTCLLCLQNEICRRSTSLDPLSLIITSDNTNHTVGHVVGEHRPPRLLWRRGGLKNVWIYLKTNFHLISRCFLGFFFCFYSVMWALFFCVYCIIL
jgi:hypothetical protein